MTLLQGRARAAVRRVLPQALDKEQCSTNHEPRTMQHPYALDTGRPSHRQTSSGGSGWCNAHPVSALGLDDREERKKKPASIIEFHTNEARSRTAPRRHDETNQPRRGHVAKNFVNKCALHHEEIRLKAKIENSKGFKMPWRALLVSAKPYSRQEYLSYKRRGGPRRKYAERRSFRKCIRRSATFLLSPPAPMFLSGFDKPTAQWGG